MRLRIVIPSVLCLATIFATAPACAVQVYKWVDERGVTNYSNAPPADRTTAKKIAIVEDRLSVYTPDKQLLQDVEAAREQARQELKAPRYTREPEVQWQRPPDMYGTSASASSYGLGYDPCLDAANLQFCYDRFVPNPYGYGYGYAYGYAPLIGPRPFSRHGRLSGPRSLGVAPRTIFAREGPARPIPHGGMRPHR